jgi:hypothetical protein
MNERLTLFGRYNKAPSRSETRQNTNLSNLLFRDSDTQTLTFGATMMMTPSVSNEVRVNYSDNDGIFGVEQDEFGGSVPIPRELLLLPQFVPSERTPASALVSLSFQGLTGRDPRVSINESRASQRQLNIVDNISFTSGAHQLKFGVDYRRLTPTFEPRVYSHIVFFDSQADVNRGIAPLGFIFAGRGGRPVYTNFSAFAQDTWKLSRRLTLSLGLRWELNPPPTEAGGNPPFAVMGLDNLATLQLAPQGTPLWRTTYNNLAPRFGFAYQLSQAPGRETVLRGGGGVFYDTGNSQGSASFDGFPFGASRTVTNVSFPLSTVQVAPPQFSLSPPFGVLYAFEPELKLPYTLQWNLAVQQSLGQHQSVTASYVGSEGRRLLRQRSLNLRTINPNFTTLNLTSDDANSDYHSLQLQFQRRLSHGLQALASYTWAHAIDDVSTDLVSNLLLRGNSDFDIRHNFATALTYDISAPIPNRFARALLGNWSVDVRMNAQTALPLNIVAGTFLDVDGTQIARRANLIGGVPVYLDDPNAPGGRIINNTRYTVADNARLFAAGCLKVARDPGDPTTTPIGPARGAFCTPRSGSSGNLGRNVLRGLPAWQVDLALRRQFKLTERVNVQFRAEAFNLFNHPNFGTIQSNLTSPNFGQATNMLGRQLGGLDALYQIGGPRSLQFALRISF